MADLGFVIEGAVAGIAASLACGLGALPVLIPALKVEERIGLGYAFAGGLMFSASVYNLLLPAHTLGNENAIKLVPVLLTLAGILAGCFCLWFVQENITKERLKSKWLKPFGTETEALIFLAMAFHSIPEGIAVGVGFGSEGHHESLTGLGMFIAVAIGIHNMPEGLAIALPMRASGAPFWKCFLFAFLTSLPQPIAAVPASLMVWFFEPLMLPFLGFAAGAMIYLVVVELIPDALATRTTQQVAWAFMTGFCLMLLVQSVL